MNLKVLKYIKSTLRDNIRCMKLRSKVLGKTLDKKQMNLAKEALEVIDSMIKGKSND